MGAFKKSILRLTQLIDNDFDLSLLLSTLRGPDIDNNYGETLKAIYTAPIRLYLLGPTAYKESGFFPHIEDVKRELPISTNLTYDHFSNHIMAALVVITGRKLPRNEE